MKDFNMTDSQEQRTDESRDSYKIHIELPGETFDEMSGMMSGFWRPDAVGSGCCGPKSGMCCHKLEEENTFKFTVSLKRKE
jgi:hypothetical protein